VTIEGCEAYRAGKHHFGAINTDNFLGRDLYAAWAMPDQGHGNASAYVSFSDTSLAATPTRSQWYDCVSVEAGAAAAPYMSFYTHGAGMGDLLIENMRSTGGLGFVLATEGPNQKAVVRGGLIDDGALTLYSNDALVEDVTVRGPAARVLLAGSRNTVQNVVVDGARLQAGASGAVIDAGSDNTFRFSTIRVDPTSDWPGVAVAVRTRTGNGIRLYGNIIDAPRAVAVDPAVGPGVGFVSDHNLFAREMQFVFPDYTLHTLDEWRARYGQDASSVVADPLFADAAAGDLSLGAGSPAVDAFVATDLLTGIPTDALGLARPQGAAYDLGALERPA
jgi:hypothetical protein